MYGTATTSVPGPNQAGTVGNALIELSEVVESCYKALDCLRTALAPVSMQPQEKPQPPLTAVPGYGVPYADGILVTCEKLRDLRRRIEDTGERLKL